MATLRQLHHTTNSRNGSLAALCAVLIASGVVLGADAASAQWSDQHWSSPPREARPNRAPHRHDPYAQEPQQGYGSGYGSQPPATGYGYGNRSDGGYNQRPYGGGYSGYGKSSQRRSGNRFQASRPWGGVPPQSRSYSDGQPSDDPYRRMAPWGEQVSPSREATPRYHRWPDDDGGQYPNPRPLRSGRANPWQDDDLDLYAPARSKWDRPNEASPQGYNPNNRSRLQSYDRQGSGWDGRGYRLPDDQMRAPYTPWNLPQDRYGQGWLGNDWGTPSIEGSFR
uniref:Translation initiation factor IF-2 n=1 Tax=Magnetococcus massalia (strain MO-1) TaxID=451514 RepID=A0A1S7LKF2_MAGMO|nr:exported protein of unknown function [Candidatus Magnetococcus massalia]